MVAQATFRSNGLFEKPSHSCEVAVVDEGSSGGTFVYEIRETVHRALDMILNPARTFLT